MDISERTILITGGGGFVGSHLADALYDGNAVRILDDFSSGKRANVPKEARVLEGDVRDEDLLSEAFEGVDLVFHEAAVVSVPESVAEPLPCHDVTVDGTIAVLEHAREVDARVVVASSAAVYGHPDYIPIDESHPLEPTSPYGIDKITVDQYTRLYHDLYDLDTVALRYFNIYGPRQTAGDYSGVVSIFRDQATTGQPITVDGDGTQTRDFVHVDDVVQANLLAATTDHVGEAYNIGTGNETSVLTLAETFHRLTETDTEIVHQNSRPGDIDHSVADISKAQEKLGYTPEIRLDEGLRTLL